MCIWCNSTILSWESITYHHFQTDQGSKNYVKNWKGCKTRSQGPPVLTLIRH